MLLGTVGFVARSNAMPKRAIARAADRAFQWTKEGNCHSFAGTGPISPIYGLGPLLPSSADIELAPPIRDLTSLQHLGGPRDAEWSAVWRVIPQWVTCNRTEFTRLMLCCDSPPAGNCRRMPSLLVEHRMFFEHDREHPSNELQVCCSDRVGPYKNEEARVSLFSESLSLLGISNGSSILQGDLINWISVGDLRIGAQVPSATSRCPCNLRIRGLTDPSTATSTMEMIAGLSRLRLRALCWRISTSDQNYESIRSELNAVTNDWLYRLSGRVRSGVWPIDSPRSRVNRAEEVRWIPLLQWWKHWRSDEFFFQLAVVMHGGKSVIEISSDYPDEDQFLEEVDQVTRVEFNTIYRRRMV